MRFLKSLFLVCFLANVVFSQDTANVRGRVSLGAEPETDAVVTLISKADEAIKFSTKVNENGEYEFESIPVGRYILRTALENPLVRSVSITADDREITLKPGANSFDVEMRSHLQIIRETVTVSADILQPLSEVSKTVDVIGAEEIRERSEISLTDALRTVPGFRIQQLGGFGRTATIKTRGLRNQDTAVLIDGFRFRDPTAITGDASPFLSDLTTANVARIEVLRGSGSSIYGTNAIGGVVDFQTPDPRRDFNGSFSGEYGSLGLGRFRGDVGAGTGDGKIAFTTGFSKIRLTEGIDGEDDADNLNFQGRIDFNPTGKTDISGRIYLSDAFVRLNASPDTLGTLPRGQIIDALSGTNFTPDRNDPDNFQRADFLNGQVALTHVFSEKAIFSAGYSGLRTKRENENGGRGPGFQPFGGTQFSFFDGEIHTVNAKIDVLPAAFNRLTFGYEFELEKYENRGAGPTPAGDFFARARQSSNSFFAQNLTGLFNDKLQLAGGFRAQFFSLDDPVFSVNNPPFQNLTASDPPTALTFDGAASYYFAETGTKIRAHLGSGYRVPSLYERFGSFYSSFSQRFTAIGNPSLEPESSLAFDAGVEQNFLRERVRLTATYFYTKLIDTIGYGNVVPAIGSTPRPFGGYQNTKGGIARGGEFSGRFSPFSSTDVFASYTYTNSDQRVPQVAGSGIIQTLGIPEHQFTFTAAQRFGRKISVSFDYTGASSYLVPIFSNTSFSTFIYRFDGINRADLSARYSLLTLKDKYNFNVFGTIENLFDDEYFENGFRTQGVAGRIGLGLYF